MLNRSMSSHSPLVLFLMFDVFLFPSFHGLFRYFCSFSSWFQSFLPWTLRMKNTVIFTLWLKWDIDPQIIKYMLSSCNCYHFPCNLASLDHTKFSEQTLLPMAKAIHVTGLNVPPAQPAPTFPEGLTPQALMVGVGADPDSTACPLCDLGHGA